MCDTLIGNLLPIQSSLTGTFCFGATLTKVFDMVTTFANRVDTGTGNLTGSQKSMYNEDTADIIDEMQTGKIGFIQLYIYKDGSISKLGFKILTKNVYIYISDTGWLCWQSNIDWKHILETELTGYTAFVNISYLNKIINAIGAKVKEFAPNKSGMIK